MRLRGPNDVALKMRPGEITAHCGIFHCITLGNTASESDDLTISFQCWEKLRKKENLRWESGSLNILAKTWFTPRPPEWMNSSCWGKRGEMQPRRVRPWNALIGYRPRIQLSVSNPAPDCDQMSGIWEDQTEGDICKHCGCVFSLLANLRIHIKKNNGENPDDKCDIISGRWIGATLTRLCSSHMVFWRR